MLPPMPAWVRLVLAAVTTWLALLAFRVEQNLIGAVTLALGLLMVLAWFRYHDVKRAESAFNGHDRTQAWTYLESVPFGGRLLARPVRIYYHHVRALCLQKEEKWADAAREAEEAVRIAGKREEAAACHLAAARSYVHTGDLGAARRHADAARTLPHGDAVDRGLARVEHLLRPDGAGTQAGVAGA